MTKLFEPAHEGLKRARILVTKVVAKVRPLRDVRGPLFDHRLA